MRRWAPLLWYGLIFATSCTVVHREAFVHTVGSALPTTSSRDVWSDLWDGYWWVFVKGWHATEFAILFLLIRRSIDDLGLSLFLTSFAAILDEFHQTFVPGVSDVLIDVGGALTVAALVSVRRPVQAEPSLCAGGP